MDYSIVFAAIAVAALAISVKFGWRFGLWLRARKDDTTNRRPPMERKRSGMQRLLMIGEAVKRRWDCWRGLDERFAELVPNDILAELARLGITKIEESGGALGLWLTFDDGKGYALDHGPKIGESDQKTTAFALSLKRMYQDGAKWTVYLDTLAHSYTPDQIIEALRASLPLFETTIRQYQAKRSERTRQAANATAAWAKLHHQERT